jgi:hypothetical protein
LGIVVRDLEAAKDHFARAGVGPFEEGKSTQIVEREVHGRPAVDIKVRGAAARMGPVEFELLQPVSGGGVPAEMLAERGEGAVHLCAYTDDLRGESEQMKAAGFKIISSGVLADGGKFAFFDTRSTGGLMLGLYEQGA